jgi:hypothetical protein
MCGQPTVTTNLIPDRLKTLVQTTGILIRTNMGARQTNKNANAWLFLIYSPLILHLTSIVKTCLDLYSLDEATNSEICANFEFNSDIAETASQCTGNDKFWDESLGICYNKVSLPESEYAYTLYIANPSKYSYSNVAIIYNEIHKMNDSISSCASTDDRATCLENLPYNIAL